jgi:PPP family 3-phenylpropionic acid transporter
LNIKAFLFFLYTLSAIVISFLPLYLDERGFDKIQIGSAMAVALALGTASNIVFGMLSDKWQKLKLVLLILLIGQLIASLMLFSSQEKWLIWLALQLFFICYTPLPSLSDSLIMIVSEQLKKSYISFRLWGSLGFAIGAIAIGRTLQTTGVEALWLIYGSLALLVIILTLPLPERTAITSNIRLRELGNILQSRAIIIFLILIFILALSHRMNDHFLGLFMQEMGASETLIGWSWLASALSEIPVFLLLARYGSRFRPLRLLAVAAFMYGLRFVLMAIIDHPLSAIFIQCMHSVTFGIFLYASIVYLQTNIPEAFRATGQALFTITWVSLSGISASLFGGWLFETSGATIFYITAAGFAVLAAILFSLSSAFLTSTRRGRTST